MLHRAGSIHTHVEVNVCGRLGPPQSPDLMDVVGNNIANVNTSGYKYARVTLMTPSARR
ncbi:MAG: flagellar basal body protein [Thermomicrobiales bacterium]